MKRKHPRIHHRSDSNPLLILPPGSINNETAHELLNALQACEIACTLNKLRYQDYLRSRMKSFSPEIKPIILKIVNLESRAKLVVNLFNAQFIKDLEENKADAT